MTDLPAEFTFRPVSRPPGLTSSASSRRAAHRTTAGACPIGPTREEAGQRDRATLKAGMDRRIRQGEPVGLLAFDGDTPIGWCSVAPRPTFPRLRTSSVTGAADANDASVWSLTCFFVPRRLRGRGLATRLLDAAIDRARTQGARALEAYPVDPESPSYRYGGLRPMFSAAGFRDIGRLGKRRHVMRLDLPVAEVSV